MKTACIQRAGLQLPICYSLKDNIESTEAPRPKLCGHYSINDMFFRLIKKVKYQRISESEDTLGIFPYFTDQKKN